MCGGEPMGSPARVAPKSPAAHSPRRPGTAELCRQADKLSKELANLHDEVDTKLSSPAVPQGEEDSTRVADLSMSKSAVTERVAAMVKRMEEEQTAAEQVAAEKAARRRAASNPIEDPTKVKVTGDKFERRYWADELASVDVAIAVQRVATKAPRFTPRTSTKMVSAAIESVARAAAAKATPDRLIASRREMEAQQAIERAAEEKAAAVAAAKEKAAAAKAAARRDAAEREAAEKAAAEKAAAEKAAAKIIPEQRNSAAERAKAEEAEKAKRAAERMAAQRQADERAEMLKQKMLRAPEENALVQKALAAKVAAEARHDGRWPPGRDPFEVPRKSWV